VLILARQDLEVAEDYVRCLDSERAPKGLLAFCALPILLAWSALTAVERHGPGAKVARDDVGRLVARLDSALEQGSLVALLEEIREHTH
jgi:hypothetical protein